MQDRTPTSRAAVRALGRDMQIEYRWIAAHRHDAPLLVFLHEGLGSVAMWKDWPDQACAAAQCRGLVYSRYGYGRSTPRPAGEKWAPDYLHGQAAEALPALLQALGVDATRDRPVLFGHSDGGTIALLYASMHPQAVAGIAVAAPHIFVEDITIAGIRRARQAYLDGGLRPRLAVYHDDPDSAFFGWNDAWLDPAFRSWNIEACLPAIQCPILAIQGEDDEYGTLEQVRGIARQAPQTRLLALPGCGHVPHRERPDVLNRELARFVAEIFSTRAGSQG